MDVDLDLYGFYFFKKEFWGFLEVMPDSSILEISEIIQKE